MADIIKAAGLTSYFKKQTHSDKPLSNAAHGKLIKMIIEWTVRNMIWLSLGDFKVMVDKIVAMFPNEARKDYFVPKDPDPNPSGPLYNAFKKRHEHLREELGIRRNQMPRKKEKKALEEVVIPEKIDVIRQRLIHRAELWVSVLDDWKLTFQYRHKEVEAKPLANFLQRWPKFQHKRGVDMVSSFLFCHKLVYNMKGNSLEFP